MIVVTRRMMGSQVEGSSLIRISAKGFGIERMLKRFQTIALA